MPFPRSAPFPLVILFGTLASAGCETPQGPERLATVPVRGVVTVNGLPAPKLTVSFRAVEAPSGETAIYAANPSALTDADGTFALSTYQEGDGVAPGTYAVTLEWLTYDALRNSYGKPDRLKGRYADPKTTEFKVEVSGDEEALELPPFALVTK